MGARDFALPVCLAFALVLTLMAAPATAEAQAPDYAKAKAAYLKAEKAFKKREWTIAAREYGNVYAITKDPVLFYNIAESHMRNGDCDTAVVYYGRFLREAKPDKVFRKKAEDAIAGCKKGSDSDTKGDPGTTVTSADTGTAATTGDTGTAATTGDTGTAATTGVTASTDEPGTAGTTGLGGPTPPAVDAQQSSWKKTAGWVSVGATIAFATTGAVLGLSAASRQEDIENLIDFRGADGNPAEFSTIQAKYDDLVDEGDRLDMLSKVAFGLAATSAVTAVLFFILDGGSGSSSSVITSQRKHTVTPVVSARGELGLRLGWEF